MLRLVFKGDIDSKSQFNKVVTICKRFRGTHSMKCFFTTIPHSYTSLLLDGVARNDIYFFIYMDTQESGNLSCLDPFIPTSYAQGEKKNHLV